MTAIMTAEEYALFSGTDLNGLLASIQEAENDAITRDSLDASTIRKQNFTDETAHKIRDFIAAADKPQGDA